MSTTRPPSIQLHSLFTLPQHKQNAITLLSDVATTYESLCKTKAPGRTGLKRKQEYDKLLTAFKTDKQDLVTALEPFYALLNAHKDDGRLMDLLDDGLWVIANGNKILETKLISRDRLIAVLTAVDTLYAKECETQSPGTTGLLRKAKFDSILGKLKNPQQNFNLPFYQLCKMFLNKEGYSRLNAFIESALWKFFQLKLSPKCGECLYHRRYLGAHAKAHYAAAEYLADMKERHDKLVFAIGQALYPVEKPLAKNALQKPTV